MLLSLRQIEVLKAIAEAGSISGAARILCVSQPAISQSLAYMETRLGYALFLRVRGRLHPTHEARELQREINAAYVGISRINDLAGKLALKTDQYLQIVTSPSTGEVLIPRAIARFREQFPSVKVFLHKLPRSLLVQSVLDQTHQLGFQIMRSDHPSLESRVVGCAGLVCICPPGHPLERLEQVSLEDLMRYPLIGYPPESPLGSILETLWAKAGAPLRPMIEVLSPAHAYPMVQAGAGIALVDEFATGKREPPGLRVRAVAGIEHIDIAAEVIHSRYAPLSKPAKAFIRAIRAVMTEAGLGARDDAGKAERKPGSTPARGKRKADPDSRPAPLPQV